VGTENQKLKMMERERIENGEQNEILRRQMEDAMVRTEEKKRRNKRCMYILIFVVVAIIAGVGAYFGIADQGDSPTAATSVNPDVPAKPTPAPTTAAPSEIPTTGPRFDPPSEEDCAAIANGDALTNQEGAIVNEFNLTIDVTFLPPRPPI
jgi:cytoskeletal protein RodZ